jgi:hypothetical protein
VTVTTPTTTPELSASAAVSAPAPAKAAPPAIVPTAPAATTAPTKSTPAAVLPTAPAVTAVTPTTFDVLHLHKLGRSCRGRLTVSQAGVAFLPSDKSSDDAVTLKFGDLTQKIDDKTLIIRANDHTYRFVLAVESSGRAPDLRIDKIADTIARASHQAINPPAAATRSAAARQH